MNDETIKLILDYATSSRDTEELIGKLQQLRTAGQGVAETYEVLDRQVLAYTQGESRATAAEEAAAAAAVERTRAQKILAQTIEELNAKQATFGKLSRDNQMRILEFGRATQDFAQGGLMGVINNIERLVGGGGVAAGLLTVLGTVLLVTKDHWMEWFKAFEHGRVKVPEAAEQIDRLTDAIKKDKDALEELKKEQTLSSSELEKYQGLVRKVKDEEQALADARQLKALGSLTTRADRARGSAFKEALAEYGGLDKLVEELGRHQVTPERANEAILGAAGGNRTELQNILRNAPGFEGIFGPINPDLDPARKQVHQQVGQRLRQFTRNVGIAIHDRQKAARDQERLDEKLNLEGQDNQERLRKQREHDAKAREREQAKQREHDAKAREREQEKKFKAGTPNAARLKQLDEEQFQRDAMRLEQRAMQGGMTPAIARRLNDLQTRLGHDFPTFQQTQAVMQGVQSGLISNQATLNQQLQEARRLLRETQRIGRQIQRTAATNGIP